MRILVVDDEENVLRSVGRLFRRRPGAELVTATTAEAAMSLLEQGAFDAAIVDIHLGPGMSGGDLLAQLVSRWPTVRRVVCSGGSLNARDDAAEALAHVVVPKPCSIDELFAAIG